MGTTDKKAPKKQERPLGDDEPTLIGFAPTADDDDDEDTDPGLGDEGGDDEGLERLDAAAIEALTQVKLSPKLKKFLLGEAEKYEGKVARGLDLQPALRFLAGELPVFWEYATDGHFEVPSKTLVPIAACGEDAGTFFIAVDAAKAAMPVFFFDYEEGFSSVAPALDGFLAELADAAEEADEGGGGGDDAPYGRGDDGRPKDRDGKTWDYVTSEGMGFDDGDNLNEMWLEKNGNNYFKPDWGPWDVNDLEGYWERHAVLEAARDQGDDAYEAELSKQGLRNSNHWDRVKFTYYFHHRKEDDRFAQFEAEYQVRETERLAKKALEGSRQQMRDAVQPGMLDPVNGVSLETYATVQARRMALPQGDPKAFARLLAEYKLDEAKFAQADTGWQERMQGQGDQLAAAAIMTEYGKYFAAAGAGQHGAAAKKASANLGINDKVKKQEKGGEPCSFEKFVEVMAAQSVWATQGKDVNAQLQKVFGLSTLDYSNLSAYWSPRMGTDLKLIQQYQALDAKFRERYSAGGGPDDDLEA